MLVVSASDVVQECSMLIRKMLGCKKLFVKTGNCKSCYLIFWKEIFLTKHNVHKIWCGFQLIYCVVFWHGTCIVNILKDNKIMLLSIQWCLSCMKNGELFFLCCNFYVTRVDPYSKILISNGAMTYKIHTIKKQSKIFKIYINALLSRWQDYKESSFSQESWTMNLAQGDLNNQ